MTQVFPTGMPRSDFGIRVPERIHPAAEQIGDQLMTWASRVGLVTDARERARLDAAGFHLLAARVLPDAPRGGVEVFAQWVLWLFHLDDEQDEGPMGLRAELVHTTYAAITSIIEGRPVPATAPAPVTALADLWPRTARGMPAQWRRRILEHIHHHRDAFLTQITHRHNGTLATPAEYPSLRRDDNAMFMFDLLEVVHQTEIPPGLAATSSWTELCAASSDIAAWCNDVVSLPRESARGETTNYVLVLRHATGCDERTALEQVHAHITGRSHDLGEAERAFLTDARRLAPTTDPDRLRLIVRTIRDMPGAHLAWMLTSGRHQERTPAP
ncbi:terpene synthase family protein [Frankia sp. AgPm24]|uniref:terpene synthase family protein n=1 Tax=Frankia sp. AgPm24 TaxID=631128 RepID=UPI00201012C5|nr:terpene synthase family protein [Frankia sp. AgPm24]MCK9922729.1 terpene synthase family protein [Frankia sp. AgPm24]